jgi:TonB family protein
MPIVISILVLFLTLPLFSNNSADSSKISKQSSQTHDRMPMIQGDTTVDPNMPMSSKSDAAAVDKEPVPIKKAHTVYPEKARQENIEGTVWVKVLVSVKGKVKKAEVIKSEAEILNQSALDAARKWTFTPAILKNKPVETWIVIPFRFKLHG